MPVYCRYDSPLGELLLVSHGEALTGLWFADQKKLPPMDDWQEGENKLLSRTEAWLDVYFSGEEPTFSLPLQPGGTDFQRAVWQLLLKIPYGKTVSYGCLAASLAQSRGLRRMSAQAVGHAVGQNPISILIPCHRVLGAKGQLTGYAGGLERKQRLLELEAEKK